jgi:hypothetical protein
LLLSVGLVAWGQFLPGKIRQTVTADQTAVTGPVFFSEENLLPAQGAVKCGREI